MELTIDGARTHAYTGGKTFDSARKTAVFIHGAAHDHGVWNLQSRYVAAHGMNVLALDLPGHGRSGGQALASIEAAANWITVVLDTLSIEDAFLIGHSMGSLIALDAAARHGTRVRGVALLGCAVPMAVSDGLLAAARDDVRTAITMISQWSFAPSTHAGSSPVPGMWLPGINAALMRRAAPGVLHRDLLNCRDYVNGLAAAARCTCPALILAGSRDLMTPPRALEGLCAALANHRLVKIEGAGHSMTSERPDAVLDALRGFLAI